MNETFEVVNQIVMKKLNEIKPYFKNPRKNDKTVEELVKIIPQVGFNVPILIDENGVIVKGHARYKAAFRLGMEEVPCVITHEDEEKIRLDRIADNKISELSEWVSETLDHEVDSIGTEFSDILGDLSLKTDVIEQEIDDTILFEENVDNPATTMTDEQKQKLYEQMIAQKNEEAKQKLQKQIEKAEVEQAKDMMPTKKKYIKCVCEKCGSVFYIPYDKAIIIEM